MVCLHRRRTSWLWVNSGMHRAEGKMRNEKCWKTVNDPAVDIRHISALRILPAVPYLSTFPRVQTINILGVTFTSSLSVTLHVQSVVAACAETLYALRVLDTHGLCSDSLHDIFCAVAKLVCIQRLVAILQRQQQTEDLCFHSSLHLHWSLSSRSSWLARPLHFFGCEII